MSKEIEKTKSACLDCGYRIEDHVVAVTEMIEIGKGWDRIAKWAATLRTVVFGPCHETAVTA